MIDTRFMHVFLDIIERGCPEKFISKEKLGERRKHVDMSKTCTHHKSKDVTKQKIVFVNTVDEALRKMAETGSDTFIWATPNNRAVIGKPGATDATLAQTVNKLDEIEDQIQEELKKRY
jgi:hypothetical protein